MQIAVLIPDEWVKSLDPDFVDGLPSANSSIAEVCRLALRHALSHELSGPVLSHLAQRPGESSGPTHRVAMHVPSMSLGQLIALAKEYGTTPGPMGKRLIGLVASGVITGFAGPNAEVPVAPTHPMAQLNAAMGMGVRPAQAHFYDNLRDSLESNAIGLVEGGTGIGKTRAVIATAVRYVQERKATIAICAPTIAILRQFVSEHQAQHDSGIDVPPLQLIIGRREFISEVDLLAFLEGDGREWATPEVVAWSRKGICEGDEGVVDLSWQAFSLQQISPDFPIDEVRVSEISKTSDRGYVAYKQQFESLGEPDHPQPCILLCTHAMLAQEMRRRLIAAKGDETYQAMATFYKEAIAGIKGKSRAKFADEHEALAVLETEMGVAMLDAVQGRTILPAFTALIVDEGHMLDETFASSASTYLSLRTVLADLIAFRDAGGKLPTGGLYAVGESINKIIANAPEVDRRDFAELSGDANARLTPHLAAISAVCAGISGVRDTNSERFRLSLRIKQAGAAIDYAIGAGKRYAYLRHSPIRRFPQLLVTTANITTLLSRLWASLEASAVVSATLYVPTNDGGSGNFMSNLLRIPPDRIKNYTPVLAPWSTTCVQGVWRPMLSSGGNPALLPPSAGVLKKLSEDARELDESRWHVEVGKAVRAIHDTAKGGVLVLCTSYATVQALHAYLTTGEGALNLDALVTARAGVSVRTQGDDFLRASNKGMKPVWLAVGGAWTGVDIGGHEPWERLFGTMVPAEEDNVLTDLVIPRLPYGTNQSFTHLWRIRTFPNVPWDLFDASLKFKQALGRLVRRAGLPSNRRIHVLDGRLGEASHDGRLAPFERSLSRYRQISL